MHAVWSLIPAREAVKSEAVLWKISCVPEGSVEKGDERQPQQLACTTFSTNAKQFLCTLAKLRKAIISSCLSVRPQGTTRLPLNGTSEQRNNRTTEHQNNGTSEQRNNRTTEHQNGTKEQRNIRTTEHKNNGTSEQRNIRTTEHQNNGTSEQRNNRTTEHQNNGTTEQY